MDLLTDIVHTLERKFNKYVKELKERKALVDKLSANTTQENVDAWEAEHIGFEAERIHDHTVADEFFRLDLTQGTG